jgi:hypothetical protein
MPRVTIVQSNFTAGEVSPKCYGRTDVARYQNGAKTLRNCLVQIHGGAMRRWGTLFVASTKDSAKRSRLIPFVFSVTQAFMLEFGDGYVRFYEAGGGQILAGGVPYEIASPYTEDMLADLDFTQGADTMFIFHPNVMPNTLKRISASVWSMQNAPFTTLPVDEIGFRPASTATLSGPTVGTGRTIATTPAAWLAGDVGRRVVHEGGTAVITGFTNTGLVTADVTSAFWATVMLPGSWQLLDSPQTTLTPSAKDPVGTSITLTASADSFRGNEVGWFIKINGGLVKITGVTNATTVTGIIRAELTSIVASPPNAWSLEGPVWNAADGYPSTGGLYEQRLMLAGSPGFPQSVWGSKSGLYFDFTMGDVDDDALAYKIPSTGQINKVVRMASTDTLIPLTYGAEFTIEGGIEKPLTPSNVRAKLRSTRGCSTVKPIQIGAETVFVQRAGRKVRSISYNSDTGQYGVPDLTVLAEHITQSGVVDMAYQQEPGSLLWCVLANGKIAVCTKDTDESVIAWSSQDTDGFYESVACIPRATGDELWVIVRRTINGETKRYVERFDESLLTDCAIVGTSDPEADTWSGLDHLEGKTVVAKEGNTVIGRYVVAGGEITMARAAASVEIGLDYTTEVTPLRPEIQSGDGSSTGNNMRTHEVALLFKDTIGCKVNGSVVPFRRFDQDALDSSATEFAGFGRIGLTDWKRGESSITITQEEPLPFHLLAIARKFTSNS